MSAADPDPVVNEGQIEGPIPPEAAMPLLESRITPASDCSWLQIRIAACGGAMLTFHFWVWKASSAGLGGAITLG